MKREELLKAMTEIDDFLIEEAVPASTMVREPFRFSFRNARYILAFAAVLLFVITGIQLSRPSPVQTGTPFTECATIKEAEELAGFPFEFPEQIEGYTLQYVNVYGGTMIEAGYAEGDDTFYVRKAEGNGDISGDVTEYVHTERRFFGSQETELSYEEGVIRKAVWFRKTCAYAAGAENLPLSVLEILLGYVQ